MTIYRVENGMKGCTRCHEKKIATLEYFSKHSQTTSGLHPWCRKCHRDYSRTQREKNPYWIILSKMKSKAASLGLPFDLDENHLRDITTDTCPILGINIGFGRGTKTGAPDSASLDRLIPHKGYVKGNVVFMSMKANLIKQDATPHEVDLVAKWMKENVHE